VKTETNLTKRWEKGTEHHPRSRALYRRIEDMDFALNSDSLCLKSGGDGDNGESLMFLLDTIFEAEDNGELDALDALVAKRKKRRMRGEDW